MTNNVNDNIDGILSWYGYIAVWLKEHRHSLREVVLEKS
jgi:hypothetical protein